MGVHKKKLTKLLIGLIIGNSLPLTLAIVSFAWFYSNTRAKDQNVDGSVGLREYFYRGDGYIGDGSEEYPHEIVTPLHFYNLTRLQNLGVFPEKTYFRVGHVFEGHEAEGPKCLDGDTKVDVLDMTSFCASSPLLPIGNEGTPFYGEFDGNFIPIIGLRVAGNPEDVGVFGYIAYTSTVKNIICKNLEVSSKGYSTTDESNFLYSETINDIFSQNATNFELAGLSFISTYPEENHTHNLKQVQPFGITDLESKAAIVEDTNSQFYGKKLVLGKFVPTFPNISNHNIEYSITSSTGAIELEKDSNNLVINLDNLPEEFDDDVAVMMSSNISLVASIKLNSIKYSRVIQTYSVEIIKDSVITNGPLVLSLNVKCDHILDENDNPINFGHGNNVGYLVGHADGNVIHGYVYNGTLLLNNDNASMQNVESQTEIGLIGKMGNNVITDIDPNNASSTRGDIGVLNFSYIYSLIREPFEAGDQTIAGYQETYNNSTHILNGPAKSFIAYATDKADNDTGKYLPRGTLPSTFNLYKEYLRTDTASPYKHFITSAGGQEDIIYNNPGAGSAYTVPSGALDQNMNSVDFAFNKVICDGTTDEEYRGLGVFKIVTGYSALANDPNLTSMIWRNDIGGCSIVRDLDENAKTAIYFSTAECDWTKGGGWSASTGNITPAIMNTIPSYTNIGSFRYPFSRDFNYMFRLDLSEANEFKYGNDIYNYMYDTDSLFLKNYLSSILIDRMGKPVDWGNKGFGFKVQFSQDSNRPVTELNSYMKIGQPSSLNQYTVNGETKYYPQKSVAFSIDSPRGANVSIAGCGGHISIYKYNPDDPSEPIEELYTMRSSNGGNHNYGRFFPYSANGETNTASVVLPTGNNMTSEDFLYGHIFTLPRGHYVIGSSRNCGSTSANLYYVCVQGQSNGDLGEIAVATIGNYVHDVDFLMKDPVSNTFDINDSSFFAALSFSGNFTDDVGRMVIDTCEVDNEVYIRMRFNDFITYLLLYCRKTHPSFVLNNEAPIIDTALYDGPFENLTVWGT